ncbi:FUSC family protein [Streptomyces sp. ISL-98]|uniref:FUSC family protein n=1 Tax=Streptomyces sp. ISL-98 TaxID=2819192 RepID=UPI001BE63A91|nr:FUSC family protein [Streptomyces sp. ISL-98]MBT2506573.1 FUSC family protein [Streptomyces sp. ISL-98]
MAEQQDRKDRAGGGRLTPPEWLTQGLRPQRAPVPWAAVVRAGIAMAAPLAVGFAADRPTYGALVSMGALSGVIGDTADAYRMRIFNIAVPQLFGAIGVTLGTLVYGHGWLAVGVLTFVALVSGMISTIGAVASVSGLLLLLQAVVGAGLPMPDPWWTAPLLFTVGGLFVLLLSLVAWPLRAGVPERDAVADTYRAAADLLEAAGTDAYDEKRQAVTQALNTAYDLVLARRAREHGRTSPLVRLLAQLNVVIPLVESAPAAHLRQRPLPREIPAVVRDLADAVAHGRTGTGTGTATGTAAGLDLPEPTSPSGRAVDHALRHAAAVVLDPDAAANAAADADVSPPASASVSASAADIDDRLGRPAALGVRARRATRAVLVSHASWRYGLRLALCIGLAQSLVSLISVPRSYWVALTVVFVLKPDFGSVFSRAVQRAFGTALGLVVAAAVLAELERGWWDVPVMMVLAALIPAFTAKGYAFQTAAITPVILLLSDLLNHEGFGLVLPRLYDSLIGCGIALVAGYLLWPESWSTRVGDRLADTVADTAGYVECAFGPPDPQGERRRQRLRRRLYRDLSVVRSEFQRALTEPPPTGARAAAWWPLVVATERIVDATTAARVRINHGAEPPAEAEVAAVAGELRELAEAVRASAPAPPRPPTALPDPPEGVLAPLRQEVAAARAVASSAAVRV